MSEPPGAAVVPAIGVPSSVAAVRSLGRAGVDVVAVSEDPNAPAFSSKYCSRSVVTTGPGESLSAYARTLLELAAEDKVRTILPLREADVYVLARHNEAFTDHIEPTWPSFDTLRAVQDRWRLLETADSVGVPTPETTLLTDWPDHRDPAVVKSRYSIVVDEATDRAQYPGVRTYEAEDRPTPSALREAMGHRPLCQAFVPNGGEFGYFALFDRGEPVATFQHRRLRSHTYGGGASVYRTAEKRPELERYGSTLLSALEWHGPAMVEFRRDARDGTFRLMEINPRYWGSLALAIHAGVDFPRYHYRMAVGETPIVRSNGYETDVGCHKLRGELLYLYNVYRGVGHGTPPSLGGELRSFVRSLARHPNFDYLDLDDPWPFVADLRRTIDEIR